MPASSEMLMRRDTREKKLRWDSHRPTGKLITYKWYLTLKKFLHQKDLNVTAFKLTCDQCKAGPLLKQWEQMSAVQPQAFRRCFPSWQKSYTIWVIATLNFDLQTDNTLAWHSLQWVSRWSELDLCHLFDIILHSFTEVLLKLWYGLFLMLWAKSYSKFPN